MFRMLRSSFPYFSSTILMALVYPRGTNRLVAYTRLPLPAHP